METTLISPDAVRELLLNSGWTYHPEHKVFTQFLDLELSPKFWDSDRTLPSDDCNFDRLARHMGIPRDTLIEDLEQRTQRMQDEKLDPQKAPRINSEKIIFPEALNIWMVRQGFSYDANQLTYSRRTHEGRHSQVLRALRVPLPASDPYFVRLANNVGMSHAELVETLCEWSQQFLESNPAAEEKESAPDEIESEAAAVPRLLGETLAASIRAGLCYAQECRHDADTQHGPNPWAEQIDCDIRMMRCALKMLRFIA